MTASTIVLDSVRAALSALIDYAGLFPPAELSLMEAQREYELGRGGPHAWMLGRFILPARLLTAILREPLSVIVDPHVDALKAVAAVRETDVRIEVLEISLANTAASSRTSLSRDEVLDVIGALEADLVECDLKDVPAFVEIPRNDPWATVLTTTMQELARTKLGAKLRCGGATAAAYPTVEEVARFIATANANGVPFKATAGLHHPVRRLDPGGGFMMHGFLNLLAASALAPRLDGKTIQQIVAEEDASAFSFDDTAFCWRDRRIGISELREARRTGLVAYGSCSFAEPVDDLLALGVLAAQ